MTGRDEAMIFSLSRSNGEPDRVGAYDDFAGTENRPTDFVPGLVSLSFIKAAIGRGIRFLFVMAVAGLVVGLALYKETPHPYQASASIVLTLSPYENVDSQSEPQNNQALAQTRTVAGLAERELGLQQSVSSFLSTYIVTSITDRVMTITASGPSANQAVARANAVASAFLNFRADELQSQQNLVLESLNQQVSVAKQRVESINAQIAQVSSQSQLSKLKAEETTANEALGNAEAAVNSNQTTVQPEMRAALKGSEILGVAPLARSKLKSSVSYAVIGFLIGLALGLTIIIIRALISDRLRRRDDIAYAFDAPVKLSVGEVSARHRLPSWPGRAARRDLNLKRVVAYLRGAVPRSAEGPGGLAIVAVDNAPVVAPAVAALAASYASQGVAVVAADLSQGAHLAHLLGVKGPGVHTVNSKGANFTLAVPDRDDAAPAGPLRPAASGPEPANDALSASYASADLLLALVTLDPALGGDYLASWATNAVVVVTAGQSSAVRIHGVGEMIRLAGTRLNSAVLIGADKSDESLGLTPRPDEQASIGVLGG